MVGYEMLAQEQRDLTPEQVSRPADVFCPQNKTPCPLTQWATRYSFLNLKSIDELGLSNEELPPILMQVRGLVGTIHHFSLTMQPNFSFIVIKGCREVEEPSRGTLQNQRAAGGRR